MTVLMQFRWLWVFVVMTAGLGGCASIIPSAPANKPPTIPPTELIGTPGVDYSSVIEAVGEATLADGPVASDGLLFSFGYRYRHTAVLTEDVMGFTITTRGLLAPAGSPGFYAATFAVSGTYVRDGVADLWCFFPSAVGGARDDICLLRTDPGLAAIAPSRQNPYLWRTLSPMFGSFDYAYTPIFERQEVEIPGDLTVRYYFDRWTANELRLEEFAGGQRVRPLELNRNADGSAILRTVAGTFEILPVEGNARQATIRVSTK